MISGGCFCGKLRYEIDPGDYLVASCYCSMCRRISAAPFVTWLILPKTRFRYVSGKPSLLHSSATALRHFCGHCGTPVAFMGERRPDMVDITTRSLDHPENYPPTLAVHEESRLPWLTADDPTRP
ncbi:MAG: hypothetical protein RLZZ385_1601 [Pseudomonadota bacterium]|jgi:hypothetical protein